MKRPKRLVAGLCAAAAGLSFGWYYGSPWWTLWRMRAAARSGDLAQLLTYFDVPAMVADGQRQSRANWGPLLALARRGSPGARQMLEAARRALDRPAEALMVRPQDLKPWFANVSVRWGGPGQSSTDGMIPYVVHYGLDRFEVRDRRSTWDRGPLLTFRRHGLGWKLAGVRWAQQ